jgi:hypothetical protein
MMAWRGFECDRKAISSKEIVPKLEGQGRACGGGCWAKTTGAAVMQIVFLTRLGLSRG